MTPEALAQTHARAFAPLRGWSAQEFRDLLDSPHVFQVSHNNAFALGRVIAGEAELLTIAVPAECQRQGLGRHCLLAFESRARALGATSSFLEVAEDNDAALALYRVAGYRQIARRMNYYSRPDGEKVSALIMRHDFS